MSHKDFMYLTEDDLQECRRELYKYGYPQNHYAQADYAKAIEAKVVAHIHEKGFRWIEHATQLNLPEVV